MTDWAIAGCASSGAGGRQPFFGDFASGATCAASRGAGVVGENKGRFELCVH
jgi:hypothetical protein